MTNTDDTQTQNCLIFEEDEVSRVVEQGKRFGLVIEISEYLSSDDEDYEEDEERVKKGSVRVAWFPEGDEEIIEEEKLTLEDRSLMPGDVVRRLISGTNSQRGFVKDMRVLCDLRIIGSDQVIPGVDARELMKTEDWDGESELITLDSWVGRVEQVNLDVVLRLPDNSRLELSNVDMVADYFNDASDSSRGEETEFRSKTFYEGQIIEDSLKTILEHDHEWLTESKQYGKPHCRNCTRKLRLVVEEVSTRELEVHWMCRGYSETETPSAKLQMPPKTLEGEVLQKVRRLGYFEHCSIQIGDRAYFPVSKADLKKLKISDKALPKDAEIDAKGDVVSNEVCQNAEDCCDENVADSKIVDPDAIDIEVNGESKKTEDKCQAPPEEPQPIGEPRSGEPVENGEKAVEGADADGEYESGSELEEQPHGKVRKRTYSGSKHRHHQSHKNSVKKPKHRIKKKKGPEKVPVEVVHSLSLVDVMWQDGSIEKDVPSYQLFPIHHLDEREFFPGDFVVKEEVECSGNEYGVVTRVDHEARTCVVKWVTPYQIGVTNKPVEKEPVEMSVYDIKDHPDYKFRPDQVVVRVCGYENSPGCQEAAGQIVDIDSTGELVVCWADGVLSRAYPQEVFLISDEASDYGSSDMGSDQDDSMCSWETEEEQTDTGTDTEDMDAGEEKPKKKEEGSKSEKEPVSKTDDEPVAKPRKEDQSMHKSMSEEALKLGPIDKLQLDYQLDRLESSVGRPIIPESLDHVVECYKNVISVHKQGLDLDRLLGSNYFDDKDLVAIISQVRRELRREKHNKIQTHLLQQAQSYVAARKGLEGDKGTGNDVPKSKSEPSLNAHQIQFVKDSPDGLKPVENIESELSANLEKAKTICASALKALMKQIVKVREQLEAMWQKKLDMMNEKQEDGEELEEGGATGGPPELMSPLSPDQSRHMPVFEERFVLQCDMAPSQHNFYSREHTPQDGKAFQNAVRKEMKLLRNNLPAGIRVVGFEERMDLYSVLVVGPSCTPYEDGLFFFDVQLPNSYPAVPPTFHYISFCSDRLNPNLYDDGKVCVSLLGTWGGKGTELWSSSSNMLQVLVSIQGLILNAEPYYNEAGYEKQRGTQMGMENSKVYNEMAILKLVQSMMKIVKNPPAVFKNDVTVHMRKNGARMLSRLESWIRLSKEANLSSKNESESSANETESKGDHPDFPLIPASRGFCLTLEAHLTEFREVLKEKGML